VQVCTEERRYAVPGLLGRIRLGAETCDAQQWAQRAGRCFGVVEECVAGMWIFVDVVDDPGLVERSDGSRRP
jgi:hypothetical protein